MRVAWLIHQGEEVNWSSALRLRRLDIARYLGNGGYLEEACVLRGYQDGTKGSPSDLADSMASYDAIVFAEQSEFDCLLMKELRSRHVRPALLRDHCEDMWEFPWELESFAFSDMVVCSSARLAATAANKYRLPSEVIHEHYELVERHSFEPYHKRPLVAGYMGTDGYLASQLRSLASTAGWQVKILCRPEDGIEGSVTWEESTWPSHFNTFRVLLCPQRPHLVAKSPCKVLQGLGNGMPVLASSTVDSYKDFVSDGVNGLLLDFDFSQWLKAFKVASSDGVVRSWSEAACSSTVSVTHSLETIAKQWLSLFCRLKTKV